MKKEKKNTSTVKTYVSEKRERGNERRERKKIKGMKKGKKRVFLVVWGKVF